jgi:hypothetical protein
MQARFLNTAHSYIHVPSLGYKCEYLIFVLFFWILYFIEWLNKTSYRKVKVNKLYQPVIYCFWLMPSTSQWLPFIFNIQIGKLRLLCSGGLNPYKNLFKTYWFAFILIIKFIGGGRLKVTIYMLLYFLYSIFFIFFCLIRFKFYKSLIKNLLLKN